MCFLTWIRSLLLSSPTPSAAAAAAAAVCSTSRSSNSNKTRTTSSVVYTLDMGVSECAIRSSVQSSPQGKMGMSPHQHQCHCCAAHAAVVVQQGHHHHHHHHHSGHGHSHSHNHNHNQMIKMNNNHHHHHHQHQQQDVVVQPVTTTSSSSSNDSNILAPLKSKMRVLKKLKRKMGLAPRSSNAGTNNLPPLTFHQVHGDNIRLCNGNTIAKRYESFCKGVTFSARPVRVGEKVCVKFLEISNNWSGVIRFGFTSNDPVNLRSGLPRYACPDLTNKPGYWAKALAERFAECDSVLFYYVTSAGDVHFGVNGEEKGVFFSGVETRGPLWAVIDVYGNSTAIEFVDPNRQHFNNVRRGAEHSNEDNAQHSRHSAMDDAANAGRDIDRIIVPAMQTVSIHHEQPDVALPGLRFQPQGVLFAPLPFHPTRGRNIKFSNNQCVATRSDTEFCHGYAFTSRPLVLGERLVVQILATENMYVGALALGLTSCDPARLTADDLPDDSDLLLDRPEYWVVSKDVASSPQPGDEIAFTVTHYGEVQMSKNGGPPNVVMHVDQSLQLWAFVDVYGSTQRVRMLASRPAPSSPPRQRQQMAPAPVPTTVLPAAAAEISRFSDVVQLKPPVPGGTVLVVNLPPQTSYLPAPAAATAVSSPQPIYGEVQRNSRQSTPSQPTGTMASTGSSTYVDPVTYQTLDTSQAATSSSSQQQQQHLQQWSEGLQPTPGQPSECSICYERTIDSVLYMCGHMCMCYTCALQQWRGKGGGHCPLCRATIRDVIRIYRS